MSRKISVSIAILLVLLIVAGGLIWLRNSRQPVVIGFVAGVTGKYADLGVDCRRGVELAIARQNRRGGISGRPLELLSEDDGQDEERAVAAVKTLLKHNLPVIIGHSTSSMSMATLPLINASQTLLFSPTSSSARLQDIDDNFFRTCTVSGVSAAMMARYLVIRKGVSNAGVIYDLGNEVYTQAWFDAFESSFLREGGESVVPLAFTSGETSHLFPFIEKIRDPQFDVLVIVTNSADAAMLCQQIRKSDWQVPLAMADWAATEQLISLGGRAVEGVIIQQIFNRESQVPAYLSFKEEFQRLYKVEPGFGALHAYDAATVIFTSMQQQQNGESLKQAILRVGQFQGLQYPVEINRFGDAVHATYIGVVRDGGFEILGDFR